MPLLGYAVVFDNPEVFVGWLRSKLEPAWHKNAASKEHGELNFFPERGDTTTAPKAICKACLVRAECSQAALDVDVQHDFGVWGGTSRQQRASARSRGWDATRLLAELG